MEKRSFSFKVAVFCGFLLGLSSCVELNVDLKWETATRGSIEIGAFFYRIAQGIPSDPGIRTFPSSRAGWDSLAQSIPGISVTSFEASEEPLGTRYKTGLNFATPSALSSLFAAFKQKATLESTQNLSTLTLESTAPRLSKASKETKDLWNSLWGDKFWVFTVSAPNVIRSNNVGERVDPKVAVLRVKLSSFTDDQGPPVWKLTW